MTASAKRVLRTYYLLALLSTLAASLIWGINTLFLLDAGLSNTQAFTANAFFSAGQVLFEVPTGVVADTRGRRTSYLWGVGTLFVSTLLYVWMWQVEAPLLGWAVASILIGLGFTFFSGAVEAWLVDALDASDYEGNLESVFGRGQVVVGVAMLTGSIAGGVIAQVTNLGVPYLIRALLLLLTFVVAAGMMRDVGFAPQTGKGPLQEVKAVIRGSIDNGLRKREVRWVMLAAPFTFGVGIYAFYAMQPYLLELVGDEEAFAVAGLAAAVVAAAQITGGLIIPWLRKRFSLRTNLLILASATGVVSLALIGLTSSFWLALTLFILWQLAAAAATPMRQAYINGAIPSEQRATVLSFDAFMGSAGAVVAQPALGRAADVWGYSTSYVMTAAVETAAIPFLLLARGEGSRSDAIVVLD